MGEHNSPAFAQGQAHKQALNEALSACPPDGTSTYDPSDWNGYTRMYDRGWESIPTVTEHSCPRCRYAEPGQ
jgi:hypothetical protein